MYLAKLTTYEAKKEFDKDPIIVIPIGSVEQHGAQCALGTDFIIPEYIASHIDDIESVIIVPTLNYGVCPYHLNFAGSINIGYETLYNILKGITNSLMRHGVKRFIALNGHGGNNPAIDKMALDVSDLGGICAAIDWWSLIGELDSRFAGGHGDAIETSAMMAIDPSYVNISLYEDMNAQNLTEELKAKTIQSVSFKGGSIRIPRATDFIAPSGWFGPLDAKNSNAEFGQEGLDLAINFIRDFICEYKKVSLK